MCPETEEYLRTAWLEATSRSILRGQQGESRAQDAAPLICARRRGEIGWLSLYTRQEPIPARYNTPMGVKDILSRRRDEILRIAASHGASNIRVFGSVARGEAGPDSDIDLLVDLERGRSLLDHAALKVDLEQLLERPVDVATERGLKPRIREHILREAIPL